MKNHPLTLRLREYCGVTVEELDGCLLVIERDGFIDAEIALRAMREKEHFRFRYVDRYYYEVRHTRLSSGSGVTTERIRHELSHESLVDRAWDCKKFHAIIIQVGRSKRWSGDTGYLVYPTRKRLPLPE